MAKRKGKPKAKPPPKPKSKIKTREHPTGMINPYAVPSRGAMGGYVGKR